MCCSSWHPCLPGTVLSDNNNIALLQTAYNPGSCCPWLPASLCSCSLNPVVTGGDSWLEHKGKKFVAAPDVLMGRKGLTEVLQQTSNPYEDHRALDDSWLKPSGKLKVPGESSRQSHQ